MQTNLFNYPVMQTLVFTLIPWILDRVEDDKRGGGVIIPLPMVIARKPSGMAEAIWRRDSYGHSCARGNPGLLR